MDIKPEVLDELLKGVKTQADLAGPNGLLKALTKAFVERVLEGELTHHLRYEKSDPVGYGNGNTRNGKSRKTLNSEQGEIEVAIPRDRQGSFERSWCAGIRLDGMGWTRRSSRSMRAG